MNTRGKRATSSSANPSAKPASKAPAKKPARKAGSKPSEPSPAPSSSTLTSNSSGKKRKQKDSADNISPDAATLAQFQAWQVAQEAEKLKSEGARQRAAKAAKDKSIQEINAQLLAAEGGQDSTDIDGEASDDQAPPKKRGKIDILLDADEEAAAIDLSGGGPDEDDEDEDKPGQQMEDEEEGGIFEEEMIHVSPTKTVSSKEPSAEPEDDDEEDGDEFDTNGIAIINTGLKPPSFSRISRAGSRAGSRAPSPAPSSRGNNKVTCNDFEGEALKALADAAKSMVRMNILYGSWDTTHSGKSGFQQWAADILQAVTGEKPLTQKALKLAFQDEVTKENLLTYILYGKGALLNTFISKARLIVATNYGLTGSQGAIAVRVAWLLQKTQFTYGGINLDAQTVEKSKIWGNPMIKELLQLVLFGQGGKADVRSVQEIRKNEAIPISAIILSVTATEHAIGEYRDGTCCQYPFKELGVRRRYTHHEKNWNALQKLSQKWATFYLQGVFQAIAAMVGLNDWVDGQNPAEDIEGITAMDLDHIADTNFTPF